MKTETAIDWLEKQTREPEWDSYIFEQAREMFKQQITNAFLKGKFEGGSRFDDSSEEYYNETYGN